MKIRAISLPSAALAAALVLAGCSDSGANSNGSSEASSSSAASFNDADVSFAQGMIVHHEQAIDMSDMLLAKDGVDSQVIDLAEDIKLAQGPEIEKMNSWLEDWGAEPGMSGMEGMDHGTMSEEDMDKLEAASGEEASTLYLEQMIEHHQGAIDMAEDELDSGKNRDALALAQKIVDDQSAEITTMQELLKEL